MAETFLRDEYDPRAERQDANGIYDVDAWLDPDQTCKVAHNVVKGVERPKVEL
jgi:hypothetical protein